MDKQTMYTADCLGFFACCGW